MDRQQLILAGTIVSVLGIMCIFLTWLDFYYEDYYKVVDYSYNGISIVTSGDFTDPDGIFYEAGKLGVYMPLLISAAFLGMVLRFLIQVHRPYSSDVTVSGILIILGSVYFMFWTDPGSVSTSSYYVSGGFGFGPMATLALAIACIGIAHSIDRTPERTSYRRYSQYPAGNGSIYRMEERPKQEGNFRYCPNCGCLLTEEESGKSFCKYCGASLEALRPREEGPPSV